MVVQQTAEPQPVAAEPAAVEPLQQPPAEEEGSSLQEAAPRPRPLRASRLSMPAVRPEAPAADHGSRVSRLSLPSGLPWAAAAGNTVAVPARAVEEPLQQPPAEEDSSLPSAPVQEALRPLRANRLSMPAVRPEAAAAERGSRVSRLSLPSGLPWAAAVADSEDTAAFAARPRLSMSPVAHAPPAAEQLAEVHATEAQQEQQAAEAEECVAAPKLVPFLGRSRLAADEDELPAELAPAQPRAAVEEEAPMAAQQPAKQQAEQSAAPASHEQQQQQEAEEALAATAFAAKPKLAMSPALSAGRSSVGGAGAAEPADDATAFAARPRLSMSQAGSSGSAGRAAAASPLPPTTAAAPSPAVEVAAASPMLPLQVEEPAQRSLQQQLAALRDSPTMSDNPLAAARAGSTPAAAISNRRLSRLSHSPALRCAVGSAGFGIRVVPCTASL